MISFHNNWFNVCNIMDNAPLPVHIVLTPGFKEVPMTHLIHLFAAEKKKCCYWLCHVTTEAFLDEEDLLNYISKVENLLSKSGKY